MLLVFGPRPHSYWKILKWRFLHTDGFVQFGIFVAMLPLIQPRAIVPILFKMFDVIRGNIVTRDYHMLRHHIPFSLMSLVRAVKDAEVSTDAHPKQPFFRWVKFFIPSLCFPYTLWDIIPPQKVLDRHHRGNFKSRRCITMNCGELKLFQAQN